MSNQNNSVRFRPEDYETISETHRVGDFTYTRTQTRKRDPKNEAVVYKIVGTLLIVLVAGTLLFMVLTLK